MIAIGETRSAEIDHVLSFIRLKDLPDGTVVRCSSLKDGNLNGTSNQWQINSCWLLATYDADKCMLALKQRARRFRAKGWSVRITNLGMLPAGAMLRSLDPLFIVFVEVEYSRKPRWYEISQRTERAPFTTAALKTHAMEDSPGSH